MVKIQIDWQIVVKFSELVKTLPDDKPIFVGENKIYNSTVNDVLSSSCIICRYVFCVVVILACPKRLATLAIDTPANNNNDA